MSGPLVVKALVEADHPRWEAFVAGCPEATFFHRAGWREVLERAFGHATHYLYAEAGGEIRGVLPLARIRSLLFGDALISTPFCVYGGVAALDREARHALEAAAVGLAGELGVGHLEFRNLEPRRPDWHPKPLYATFRKPIDPDPERNLLAIPRKQRAEVRKGIKAGLAGVVDGGVERCYDLYAESLRNLGTPVFARRYLEILREVFGEACQPLVILHRGRPVCGVVSFYFRDQVLPYYGGGGEAARGLGANHFMYWELMRRAALQGVGLFDFGRAKVGSGSYEFKRHYGFEPEPLHYECRLVRAPELPLVNPLNPKYRLFIAAWKRLPLPVSRFLGPWLARDLG